MQLVTPLARPAQSASLGRNDIFVYMAQAPRDDPSDFGTFRVACVRSRYVAPDFKDPPGGLVELEPSDFKDPAELDVEVDCVGLGGTATLDQRNPPPVGAAGN
ncbi:MAG: hypothetical protein HC927_05310 [Deltaproteobacteria bacterium]|nr:hypothetical protein [Deltaproteobacteria bacterium]